ncbi:transcription factor TFIIIB component B'' [Pelomyxa schiedti]|nr:transcription factor TFIIIB component B'' [Pelomyxa schiedti]
MLPSIKRKANDPSKFPITADSAPSTPAQASTADEDEQGEEYEDDDVLFPTSPPTIETPTATTTTTTTTTTSTTTPAASKPKTKCQSKKTTKSPKDKDKTKKKKSSRKDKDKDQDKDKNKNKKNQEVQEKDSPTKKKKRGRPKKPTLAGQSMPVPPPSLPVVKAKFSGPRDEEQEQEAPPTGYEVIPSAEFDSNSTYAVPIPQQQLQQEKDGAVTSTVNEKNQGKGKNKKATGKRTKDREEESPEKSHKKARNSAKSTDSAKSKRNSISEKLKKSTNGSRKGRKAKPLPEEEQPDENKVEEGGMIEPTAIPTLPDDTTLWPLKDLVAHIGEGRPARSAMSKSGPENGNSDVFEQVETQNTAPKKTSSFDIPQGPIPNLVDENIDDGTENAAASSAATEDFCLSEAFGEPAYRKTSTTSGSSAAPAVVSSPSGSAPDQDRNEWHLEVSGDNIAFVETENQDYDPSTRHYATTIIENGTGSRSLNGYNRGRKAPKRWTDEQTTDFFNVLRMTGTDFTLMSKYFAGVSRDVLKAKFKKEEKVHPHLVELALRDRRPHDIERLQKTSGLKLASLEEQRAEFAAATAAIVKPDPSSTAPATIKPEPSLDDAPGTPSDTQGTFPTQHPQQQQSQELLQQQQTDDWNLMKEFTIKEEVIEEDGNDAASAPYDPYAEALKKIPESLNITLANTLGSLLAEDDV